MDELMAKPDSAFGLKLIYLRTWPVGDGGIVSAIILVWPAWLIYCSYLLITAVTLRVLARHEASLEAGAVLLKNMDLFSGGCNVVLNEVAWSSDGDLLFELLCRHIWPPEPLSLSMSLIRRPTFFWRRCWRETTVVTAPDCCAMLIEFWTYVKRFCCNFCVSCSCLLEKTGGWKRTLFKLRGSTCALTSGY